MSRRRPWMSLHLGDKSLREQVVVPVVFDSLSLVVNLVTGVLVARELGAAGRGELAAILVFAQVIAWVFAMGCAQAVAYHQARRPEDGPRLVGTWLVILVPCIALAVLTGEALVPVLLSAQRASVLALAQAYVLVVGLIILQELIHGVLLGDHDFLFVNVARFAQPALIALGYIVLWRLGDLSVSTALTTTAAAIAAPTLVAGARAVRRHGVQRPSRALGRATLSYGLRAHGGRLSDVLSARLDLLVMPAFLAASSIGLYSVATNVAAIIPALTRTLPLIALPTAARQDDGGARTILRSLRATFVIGLALAVPLELVARQALSVVYGPGFGHSAVPLRILLPGTVLDGAAAVVWSGLYALGRPLVATLISAAGGVVTLVGLLLFLRSGGITAAALVSTTAYSTVFVASLVTYRRAAGLRWRDFVFPGATVAGGAAAAGVVDTDARAAEIVSTRPRGRSGEEL